MKSSIPLLLAGSLFFVFACSKDSINPPDQSDIADLSQLKVGNQWIYETYTVDRNGIEKYRTNDTTLILGDTVIDGQHLYVESSSFDGLKTTKLIFQDGQSIRSYPSNDVLFSLDTTLTYRQYTTGGSPDTLLITDYKLVGKQNVRVPAGEFEAYEFQGEARSQITSSVVYNRTFYGSGAGLVLQICPFVHGNGHRFEQRLVEFSRFR